jgi:hypothetical protein
VRAIAAVWLVALTAALAGVAWTAGSALRRSDAKPEPETSPARARQQEILREAIHKPGDPDLARVYHDINVQHFASSLPPMPVIWEPRLREVGALANDTFTLEGMFGHVGETRVILLNPSLQSDPAALTRTLSHEMVHAYLSTIGEPSADHGPAFQLALKRLAGEGAFRAIAADAEERASLRAWIEAEAERLEGDQAAALREGAGIDLERAELEALVAALTDAAGKGSAADRATVDAYNARREAYNRRVTGANIRAERGREDVADFNRQAERYRLMLAYPDGMD